MRIVRHILTGCLLAAAFCASAAAAPRFDSARLRELAETFGLRIPDAAADTCLRVGTVREFPVVAEISGGRVVHVGVDLFGSEYKAASDALLCDFVERYLLELLAEEDEQARQRRLYDDGVGMVGDPMRIPSDWQTSLRFDVSCLSGRGYRMDWREGGEILFSISFPAQYELIRGTNKIELEDRFRPDVLAFGDTAPAAASERAQSDSVRRTSIPELWNLAGSDPEPAENGLYVIRRGTYILDQMACSAYYVRTDGGYLPVCDIRYPVESVCNLLSMRIPDTDFTVDVTLYKYGFKTERFTCPLDRLIGYCLAQGCTPYVGIEEVGEHSVTATLIMVNADYGYNHIFKFVFDTGSLGARRGRVSASLNVFTPTHNLENLYDETHRSRNRNAAIKIEL